MIDEIRHVVATEDIATDRAGYKKLIGFYLSCHAYHDCRVYLDFKQITWISGNMCALFSAILYKLKKENQLNFFIDRENYAFIKSKLNFLFLNGFIEDFVKMPYSRTAVVLTKFDKSEDEKFLIYIENELFGNEGMQIKERKKDMVLSFLEIFTNVQLHARTDEPIFACGQYFPKSKELHFTLVDLGVGYLKPIEEFTKGKTNTAEAAIEWAIKGNSTKITAPGGTGLIGILDYCKETNGLLNIITGDTYWVSDAQITFQIPEFCGSVINLRFNCKNMK
jgi:hypothetical protein